MLTFYGYKLRPMICLASADDLPCATAGSSRGKTPTSSARADNMVDGDLSGTSPVTPIDRAAGRGGPIGTMSAETGTIARILAAPGTADYVRTWLAAALGRDPVLAYQEAATLAGMLELLTCEEARDWLLPALAAALSQDPEAAFAASLEIAAALKPAAQALDGVARHLPEPANSQDAPDGSVLGAIAYGIEE